MFCTVAKVLLFRYVYVMRQRWLLTISYLLVPLSLCFLAAMLYDGLSLQKHESSILEHSERSILQLPETGNCTSAGKNVCQLKIVVCPEGEIERELMERAAGILRLSDNTSALDVKFVGNCDAVYVENMLVSLNSSNSVRGLVFEQITPTRLEYTMRPWIKNVPTALYDWRDYATDQKFPSPMYRGPRLTDPYFNVHDAYTTLPGLLPLQAAVDKAYCEMYFPNVSSKKWSLASFPYPPYAELEDVFRPVLTFRFFLIFVQYMLMFGILLMILVFASYIINDKASGIRELLCLYGAPRLVVNISWLVSFCFEATVLAIFEMAILKLPTQNGPSIEYMSASVLCIVLIVYNYKTLCWVYLFATFLNNQTICVLIIAAYWFFSPLLQWIPPDDFVMQGFVATLPNAGIVMIFKSFQEFDGAETVLSSQNMLDLHPIHYLPVTTLLLIMLFTSVLLILLGMYVDLVKPGKYGRAKPWYLFSRKEKLQSHDDIPLPNEGNYFEPISSEVPVALECVNMSKLFKKHKAVDNINMKVPKNKITILLGHNGAGKTTLLCVLCGMYSPTNGQFRTEEYNVFQGENINKFRKVMGYCPQHNWLMGELTVKQHFIIFGLLKGLSKTEAVKYCTTWTAKFGMEKFVYTNASKLSGGTKRKLCIALAMIGDPQYLFLDEPSSSLDAESTRKFWNVLLQEKGKCTVILTTHDMDEADILGDWIAFMSKGQLKGYGTNSFLKKQIKVGYKLNCAINKKEMEKVIKVVQYFDRSAEILHQTNHAITFAFPVDKPEYIPSVMKSLKSEFGDDIATSLSYASMDDVIIKLEPEVASAKTSLGGLQAPAGFSELLMIPETGTLFCSCGQTKEIFMKKIKWTWNRKTSMIILLVILPILGTVLTMYSISKAIGSSGPSANVKFTMDTYSGTSGFITKRKNAISSALMLDMNYSNIEYLEVDGDMVTFLNQKAKTNRFLYRSKIVFAFDSGDDMVSGSPTAYYSRNAFHSAPIAYSALMNAILHSSGPTPQVPQNHRFIITHNLPIVEKRIGPSCSNLENTSAFVAFMFNIILGPVLLITASYFIMFPHLEKRSIFKHLQLMSGLLPSVYWISHLIFDILIFSISLLLIVTVIAIMDITNSGLFLDVMIMMTLIILLLLYGISTIIFGYACSFCRCSISTIVIVFVSIHPVLLIVYAVLKIIFLFANSRLLLYQNLYFMPWMILMGALQKLTRWAVQNRACFQCKIAPSCAFISTHGLFDSLKNELLGFVITSLVYFGFIVAMDHGLGRKLQPMVDMMRYGDGDYGDGDYGDGIDPDVAKEKKEVKELQQEKEENQPSLICDGLGKKYSPKITAVREVTFAAERGEIFGLLGANGAGKTTTFGMLSGLIGPSRGSASVGGKWDLDDCEYKYIRNIGYCPQFHGILPGLPGRNTLRLFGCLRGFKPPILDVQVDMWLQALDIVSIADQPCENYSGGNKRKLSFAIAMIGCPPVVLLDEPTTSIDPVVRRRIWDILITSLKERNQAIILTSHTMSECETICDRLTIMVDGKMKCLGPVSKLKNKFGKSCILHIKLKSDTTNEQVDAIQSKILEQSPFSRYAQLKEKQPNVLDVRVNTETIKTYDLFADMLKIKKENSVIEDFELTETPLEEVFMKFAQKNKSKKKGASKKRRGVQPKSRGGQ